MSTFAGSAAPLLHPTDAQASKSPPPATPPFEGQVVDAAASRSLALGASEVLFVLAGEIDLFSARRSGPVDGFGRQHLMTLPAGRLILRVGDDNNHLLAVARGEARAVRAPLHVLLEQLLDPRRAADAERLLETWIADLCGCLSRESPPRKSAPLAVAGDVKLDRGGNLRTSCGISWIRQLSGASHLLGRPELSLDQNRFLPLTSDGWFQAAEPSRYQVCKTIGLPDYRYFWDGIVHLDRLVGDYCNLVAREKSQAAAARARQVSVAPQVALHRACEQLAASIASDTQYARAAEMGKSDGFSGSDGSLLVCCRVIASSMGVSLAAPRAEDAAAATGDRLESILQNSGLRTRKVALRGKWWHSDNGPLLVFEEKGGAPLALVWRENHYETHAAEQGAQPYRLDRRHAAGLLPFGYSFYAPFPHRALSVADIYRFALRGNTKDALWVVTLALACSLLGLIPSIATGVLFNHVIPGAHRPELFQLTIILVVCAFTGTSLSVVRGLGLLRIQQRTATAVQAAIWDRLMRMPLSFFRPYTAGEMARRALSINAIQRILSGTTISAVLGGLFSLVNLGAMFHYSPTMAWTGLMLIAGAVAVTGVGAFLRLAPQRQAIRLQSKTSGLVLQLLTSINKLRVAGAEGRAFAQWAKRFSLQRRLQLKIEKISNWVSSFVDAFPVLASALIFWIAFPLMAAKDASIRAGDFLAFAAAFMACLSSLLNTALALIRSLEIIPLFEQAKPIMQGEPEISGLSDPGRLSGAIKVQNAVFRYDKDAAPILKDVSFEIDPGQYVAFVGASGSGKSTLLKLLLGFEKLESGSIFFDGQEIGSLALHAVRQQMGVVLQTSKLMAGDILSNIRGASDCTIEEAWLAAARAGIAEDIQAMPMGMHTLVSEGANTFSGGQRQRLILARAIINQPSILMLDEATSALDNRTQAIVIESLEKMNVTRIVVAHRLSTIVNADRIFVMDSGRIVQSGAFRELVAQEGPFKELARRQMT